METPSDRTFRRSDYAGSFNYLEFERKLFVKALVRVQGNVKASYDILFPLMYMNYEWYNNQLRRHGIDLNMIKELTQKRKVDADGMLKKPKIDKEEQTNTHSDYVQANLRKLAESKHIKLRSIEDD